MTTFISKCFHIQVQSTTSDGVVKDVTSNYVLPSSSCHYGSYADLPVRWNATKLTFFLSSTLGNNRYAAMSEIEIFVDGQSVHDRFVYIYVVSLQAISSLIL